LDSYIEDLDEMSGREKNDFVVNVVLPTIVDVLASSVLTKMLVKSPDM